MGKSQTERSWSSDDFTSLIILRAVAWTHEFVRGSVPWNDAAQMGANGIDTIISDAILSRNKVMSITFESLN